MIEKVPTLKRSAAVAESNEMRKEEEEEEASRALQAKGHRTRKSKFTRKMEGEGRKRGRGKKEGERGEGGGRGRKRGERGERGREGRRRGRGEKEGERGEKEGGGRGKVTYECSSFQRRGGEGMEERSNMSALVSVCEEQSVRRKGERSARCSDCGKVTVLVSC